MIPDDVYLIPIPPDKTFTSTYCTVLRQPHVVYTRYDSHGRPSKLAEAKKSGIYDRQKGLFTVKVDTILEYYNIPYCLYLNSGHMYLCSSVSTIVQRLGKVILTEDSHIYCNVFVFGNKRHHVIKRL